MAASYWHEDRSKPETLAREAAHLESLRELERLAQAVGFEVRPKVPHVPE